MLVKVLLNLGTNDFPDSPLQEGEHDLPDAFAARLIAEKLAVAVKPPKKTQTASVTPVVANVTTPPPIAVKASLKKE
jgi:hypothetical protein